MTDVFGSSTWYRAQKPSPVPWPGVVGSGIAAQGANAWAATDKLLSTASRKSGREVRRFIGRERLKPGEAATFFTRIKNNNQLFTTLLQCLVRTA
jgi:hypothetical protein